MPDQELSFGAKAVGLSFNPSDNSAIHHNVHELKSMAASFIDFCNNMRLGTNDPQVKRMLSVAITEAQTAQMWAVKAATWESDPSVPPIQEGTLPETPVANDSVATGDSDAEAATTGDESDSAPVADNPASDPAPIDPAPASDTDTAAPEQTNAFTDAETQAAAATDPQTEAQQPQTNVGA